MATINTFPVNSFYFNVEVDDVEIPFQSVSGLGVEHELEKEIGTAGIYTTTINRITTRSYPNVTLKRGLFMDDPEPWKELRANSLSRINGDAKIQLNSIRIKKMFISLAADGNFNNAVENLMQGRLSNAIENFTSNGVVLNWTLYNLVPVKWQISALDSMNNEFLTETIEFAYEGLELNY